MIDALLFVLGLPLLIAVVCYFVFADDSEDDRHYKY